MPRVNFVKRARKDHPGGIKKGESYYWWSFRYGGDRYSKTYPRRSQLTQSRAGEVYADLESLEDTFKAGERDLETLAELIRTAASTAEEVGSEMRNNADEYFGGGGRVGELADGYDEWTNVLNEIADRLESLERDDINDDVEWDDQIDEIVNEAIDSDLDA